MFDYIIVGGGSAGCVLANRLSEDPTCSVLLLEAGHPDKRLEIQMPAAFSRLFKTKYDWNYNTEAQPGLNKRRLYWPRGKVLGGSSAINAMIYIRGNAHDYDQWANLGNPGWSFGQVLPFFKRGQHQSRGASAFHGVGGPLSVSDLRDPNLLSLVFLQAGRSLGHRLNPDFNAREQHGFGLYQVTQKDGQRHSAAAAYLKPALKRPNLHVQTQAHVLHLNLEQKRVVGVTYRCRGRTETVQAGEVLLCGGAINSPQVLLLSGIGPAGNLKRVGVSLRHHLPGVGQNLHDHLAVPVIYRSRQAVSLAKAETPWQVLRYLLFRRGPLTSNVAEAGAFVNLKPGLQPDLQYHFGPVYYQDHGLTRFDDHGFTIGPTLLHPQSRGQIRLRSTNPFEPPLIDPAYGTESADIETLVGGVELGRELAHAAPFNPYRGEELWPGPKVQTQSQLRHYVRQYAETLYHPVGTCKMGQDSLAVVDASLKVHGLKGLRVVDASVMPNVISGNTNAPTLMIAEKAADLIRSGR